VLIIGVVLVAVGVIFIITALALITAGGIGRRRRPIHVNSEWTRQLAEREARARGALEREGYR
jgi:hypothetical protein